ncbi:hypothetical protein ES703_109807 [subsurface metagenome]
MVTEKEKALELAIATVSCLIVSARLKSILIEL